MKPTPPIGGRPRAELFEVIADALPIVLAYLDTDERYAYANRFYRERYARPAGIVGLTLFEAVGDEQYARLSPYVKRVLAGETVSFETEVRRHGEPSIVVTATYVPDFDERGRVRGFSALSEDVTVQRAAERDLARTVSDLRAANETLDAVVSASPAAIMLLDLDAVVRMWNPAAERIFGWPAAEAVGKRLAAIDAAHEEQFLRHLAHVAAGNVIDGVETKRRRHDGEFDAAVWAAPVRRADGRVQCLSVVVDITARRRVEDENVRLLTAERRARERLARLHEFTAALSRARTANEVTEETCRVGAELAQAYSGVIWLRDATGALVLAGSWGTRSEYIETFRVLSPDDDRYPASVIVRTGEPVWIETEEEYARELPALYPAVKAAGRLSAFGAVPLVLDGRPAGAIVFAHEAPHRYDADERTFYTSLAQHCSQALERARLLDEARAANVAAEQASRVKDEFLAMLGHELRNPLSPILTALYLMNAKGGDTFARERKVIERQVSHLGRLVDDLLDVARIASGHVVLDRVPLRVADFVARGVEISGPLLDERRHALDVRVANDLVVDGDPTRLAQVVANLVTNAAKYTPPGGHIVVAATRLDDEIELRVRDDGVGIAPELLPRVFDLFSQGAQTLNRPSGGLGLGLAIVKNLVGLHGGSVAATSGGEHRGAEIAVRLPVAPSSEVAVADDAARASVATHARGDVLVVDDNDDAAELLAAWLSHGGHEVRVAHDGPTALQMMAARQSDVALLDIGLPIMDGVEVGKRIRAAYPRTRLIALSGYGQPNDRARTREAGFLEHLVKPVDLQQLDRVLADLLAS